MRCPSCGTKLKRRSATCPQCGAPLNVQAAYFGGAARGVRASWGLPIDDALTPAAPSRISGYFIFAIIALVLIAGMLAAIYVIQRNTIATTGVALSETVFPDERLLTAAEAFDRDANGRLADSEIALATSLDISGAGIEDLTGIRELWALVDLDASGNDLTEADLSGLVRLRRLNLSGNAITSFSSLGMHDLLDLDVSDNGMTALELDSSDQLVSLKCSGNAIARLDLASCTALMDLECDPGQNTVIPLSEGFVPDESLRGALLEFDTDGDGALSDRERQAVTELDVADSALQSLYGLAWFNELVSLDVSNTQLKHIACTDLGPNVSGIDASGSDVTDVDLTSLSKLASLDLSGTGVSDIDLYPLTRLTSLNLSNCNIKGTLDVTSCVQLEQIDLTGNPSLIAVVVPDTAALAQKDAVKVDRTCTIVHKAVA